MITDPFHLPYGSLNIQENHWCELQKNERLLNIAEEAKERFSRGLSFTVSNSVLEKIGQEAKRAIKSGRVYEGRLRLYSYHYVGIALCILSHGKMEWDFNESVDYVYSKSTYENEAYLDENMVIGYPSIPGSFNVLKSKLRELGIPVSGRLDYKRIWEMTHPKKQNSQMSLFG